jgi:hypothetical protein
MKFKRILDLLLSALFYTGTIDAQNRNVPVCENIVLSDNFSAPANWSVYGNNIGVSNGVCNFPGINSSIENRIAQNFNAILSDTYFKADCELTVNSNSLSNGAGAVVIALTAGNLDFMSYSAAQNYAETAQDGIAAVLFSTNPSDNNLNNWAFLLEGKKGNVRSPDPTNWVYLNSSIHKYYLRVERTSVSTTKLSVFTDPAFSVHLTGSPVTFTINPLITGLNTIQHGVFTPGHPNRLMDGNIDNDFICDDKLLNLTAIPENLSSRKLNVFPNPFSTQTSILLENELPEIKLQITDITGKEINADVFIQERSLTISRNGLQNGIYFLSLFSENKLISTAKLIVE